MNKSIILFLVVMMIAAASVSAAFWDSYPGYSWYKDQGVSINSSIAKYLIVNSDSTDNGDKPFTSDPSYFLYVQNANGVTKIFDQLNNSLRITTDGAGGGDLKGQLDLSSPTFSNQVTMEFDMNVVVHNPDNAGIALRGCTGIPCEGLTDKPFIYWFNNTVACASYGDYQMSYSQGQWYHYKVTYDSLTGLESMWLNDTQVCDNAQAGGGGNQPDFYFGWADNGKLVYMNNLILYNASQNPFYSESPAPETCSVCNETCSPCGGGCTATNLNAMYSGVSNFDATYGDITGWDTSCITSMDDTFRESDFNQDISGWNTSSVTSMVTMFYLNSAFNQPIGSWDVSHVASMSGMLTGCPFNQDLSAWNTSQVISMNLMFDSGALS